MLKTKVNELQLLLLLVIWQIKSNPERISRKMLAAGWTLVTFYEELSSPVDTTQFTKIVAKNEINVSSKKSDS